MPKPTLAQIRKELVRLQDAISEKRSDICDVIDDILQGRPWAKTDIEHRYVRGVTEDGMEVEYDTLTTLLRYKDEDGVWDDMDMDYEDDPCDEIPRKKTREERLASIKARYEQATQIMLSLPDPTTGVYGIGNVMIDRAYAKSSHIMRRVQRLLKNGVKI